jgi:hypothetical protein
VHVNHVLIGVSGQIEARELSWNTAQLFFVPPTLLRTGTNEIELRLHPDRMARQAFPHCTSAMSR